MIFFYKLAHAGVECFFRRVEYYDEKQDRVLVFLTNHLVLSPATIAAVYKERWAIELFQASQTEPTCENLCGNLGQRFADADLGGADCHVADQVPATEVGVRLVAVEIWWRCCGSNFLCTGTCGCGSTILSNLRCWWLGHWNNWSWASVKSWTAGHQEALHVFRNRHQTRGTE